MSGTESNGDIPPVADYQHPMDIEQYRKLGHKMVDMVCEYYKTLEQRPVTPNVQPGFMASMFPKEAPEEAEEWDDIMSDLTDKILPGMTHWQHPRFFAYYSANASFPAMLADMMTGAINAIGFSWAAGPAMTELEMAMMDWVARLCGLPDQFLTSSAKGGGAIQGTSSEASLVALLAARARALEGRAQEEQTKLVVYTSDQAHSAIQKACMVAGVQHYRPLPTRAEDNWALRPQVLEEAIKEDEAAGLLPCYLNATIGTTSSAAVDPVEQLAQVAKRHKVWVNVDAAYAGSMAILPEMRHHFKGLDLVDSYNFNPHKSLLVNFDCCAMFVADAGPLKKALSLTPAYLEGKGNVLDFKDWQIPLGRRFRSLKLFFVLRAYGAAKLREFVRHHVQLAGRFAQYVREDSRFALTTTPSFGLVCFHLVGQSNEAMMELLEAVNASGRLFLVHTKLGGQVTLRMAIGGVHTQARHVDEAWRTIKEAADKLLTN